MRNLKVVRKSDECDEELEVELTSWAVQLESVFRWSLTETGRAGGSSDDTISFPSFLRLLEYPSHDTLSMFDSRYVPPSGEDPKRRFLYL